MLDMAGSGGAVGCVWLAGYCVGRRCWVPGGLGAESGIASAEWWSAQSILGSMAMQSNDVTPSRCVADWLLILVVSECWGRFERSAFILCSCYSSCSSIC